MYHLTFLRAAYDMSGCSTSNLIFGMVSLFSCSYHNKCIIFIHCSFNLYLPNDHDTENLFTYLSIIHTSSLLKGLFKYCAYFYWTLGLSITELYGFSLYSGYKSLLGICFANILSQFVVCLFIFLTILIQRVDKNLLTN